MSTQSLVSEQYAAALSNHEPSNYTMLPNFIDHLTYDEIDEKTGESCIRRLSVHATHLYRVLRSVAGQENLVWKNSEHLAELANMSVGQICNCKKELQNKFHQLDGNPLIEITKKNKVICRNGEKQHGTTYHIIHILHIWAANRAFFVGKKLEKLTAPDEGTLSPHESVPGTLSPHESVSQGTLSLSERNKINSKTPLFREQHSTAEAVPVVSSHKKSSVSVGVKTDDEKTGAFNWLMQMGADIKGALFISQNYSCEDIHLASGYVQKQLEKKRQKNEPITNPIGYLRKALENRWWKASPAC